MKSKLQTLFDKSNIRRTLLNFVFVLYVFSLILSIKNQLFYSYSYENWQVSEWLMNYQGGYVRRGLVGEILFFFAKNFDIDIEWTIKIFSLLCCAILSTFFVRSFLKKGYVLYILPLSFFLGAHFVNGMYWQKRDYLIFILMIAVFWMYHKTSKQFLRFLTTNVFLIIALQVHEAIAFFTLPFLCLFLLNEFKPRGFLSSAVLSLLFLAPSIAAFLLTLHYHGDMNTAQVIWDSWVAVKGQNPAALSDWSHGALSAIGWKREMAFNFHFNSNFWSESVGVVSVVFWTMTIPVVYYIVTNILMVFRKSDNTFTHKDQTTLSSILIFQFVCLTPFFLSLSCDLGRIFFYWIASSFVIFLLVPKSKLENVFPKFYLKIIEQINNFFANILRPTKAIIVMLILFIGVPTAGFSFDFVVNSSVAGNIMMLFSKLIILLK